MKNDIRMKKLVIQIPAFNEAEVLPKTLAALPHQIAGIDQVLILVIDDGSTDNTTEVALQHGADFVVRHRLNRGLSNTFMTGIQTSLALGADVIVNTDADNQYPGEMINELVKPILSDMADMVIGDRQPLLNRNFSKQKGVLEAFGSWVVRKASETDTPDAPSGFRAYSRYASLRLQVHNPYSYTLETLIQAGRERMKIVHVPISTNQTERPSRLHKGLFHFILNQGGAIIRAFILYQPLKTFSSIGTLFFSAGLILLLRFLFLFLSGESGVGRYTQSVSIGGTLSLFGFILIIVGFLGDAIRANRQVLTETQTRLRDQLKIDMNTEYTEINGEPLYSKQNHLNNK